MFRSLLQLSAEDLRVLATAIRTGRVGLPCTPLAVARCLNADAAGDIAADLTRLAGPDAHASTVANALELLSASAERTREVTEKIDLVISGPERNGAFSRDTGVVVREAFSHAEHSVLIAGYALHQGRRVFETLANRMAENPGLDVRMMLDIARGPGDTSGREQIISHFIHRFRKSEWPAGTPHPEIYFDPRSLDATQTKRSALHAKCIVVDNGLVFVSSANFTEAAQDRNIEVGLLVRSPILADQLTQFFDALIAEGHLERVL